MIEFKNNKIRIRCLECREEHYINREYKNTEKQQRSFGFEYEHTFLGELSCSHIDNSNESCLIMDDITNDSLNVYEI